MESASRCRYYECMNENTLALCLIFAATVCYGLGGWWCCVLSARHAACMAQLSKQVKHHESLFKPEYDRLKTIPSYFNDQAGWLNMARAVMI
jgi:hypothetical protein